MPDSLVLGVCRIENVTNTTNGRLLFHRTVLLDPDRVELDERPLRSAAARIDLGQKERDAVNPLVAAVAERRARALAARGQPVVTIELTAQGAVVTGTGTGGVRDIGIELHGTYGWPILPGSTLKGVTREYARQIGEPLEEIFGSEPEADRLVPGAVTFFDALPGPKGVEVAVHVLTPHTRGYRSDVSADERPKAPGEHINPVPIEFLAIERGAFVAHLAGAEPYLTKAAELLIRAVDDLGVGAKTAAGYGYLHAERRMT